MGKATLLLIATLVAVPFLVFRFDQPLTPGQWTLLREALLLMGSIALLCFVVGELSGNVSQVDKLWSITPVLYSWFLTWRGGELAGAMEPRMLLMSAVATVWGIRLTYNFSRHGGYSWKFWSGNEDYRWNYVRAKPGLQGRLRWTLFHFFFICLYQNALLMLIALPILLAFDAPHPPGIWDYVLAAAYLALVVTETAADLQQQSFQAEKKRRIAAGERLEGDYANGFISSGLWSRARHPNYAAEQSLWFTYFLFSVAATGRFNWTIVGCLLLMLLFQASANLKEGICTGKYPRYPDYVKRTPRFIPRFF